MSYIYNIMHNSTAITMDCIYNKFRSPQACYDYWYFMFNTNLHIMLETIIGVMTNLIDCKWCYNLIRIFFLIF